jgi:hypothetical protein
VAKKYDNDGWIFVPGAEGKWGNNEVNAGLHVCVYCGTVSTAQELRALALSDGTGYAEYEYFVGLYLHRKVCPE